MLCIRCEQLIVVSQYPALESPLPLNLVRVRRMRFSPLRLLSAPSPRR